MFIFVQLLITCITKFNMKSSFCLPYWLNFKSMFLQSHMSIRKREEKKPKDDVQIPNKIWKIWTIENYIYMYDARDRLMYVRTWNTAHNRWFDSVGQRCWNNITFVKFSFRYLRKVLFNGQIQYCRSFFSLFFFYLNVDFKCFNFL